MLRDHRLFGVNRTPLQSARRRTVCRCRRTPSDRSTTEAVVRLTIDQTVMGAGDRWAGSPDRVPYQSRVEVILQWMPDGWKLDFKVIGSRSGNVLPVAEKDRRHDRFDASAGGRT